MLGVFYFEIYLLVKDYKMKKVVKLTESDLINIINKVVSETNIVKDGIKPSPYNPKMESEEIDEEEVSEVDTTTATSKIGGGCCKRGCQGTSDICDRSTCKCIPRHKWDK